MRAVRSQDTTPEITVRLILRRVTRRYRVNADNLPGKPDIVIPTQQKAIFVHGCFWHGHGCRRGARVPKTNTEYWIQKVRRNRRRDATVRKLLRAKGWEILTIWECQTVPSKLKRLTARIESFASVPSNQDSLPS